MPYVCHGHAMDSDPDLAAVVERWPDLPEETRRKISDLIESTTPDREDRDR